MMDYPWKWWIILENSSLKLFPDISNERKAHAFPNDFGIPPSKEFHEIERDSNWGGNMMSWGIFPLKWFSFRCNVFKDENTERKDVKVINNKNFKKKYHKNKLLNKN